MADKEHRLTDEKLEEMEKRLSANEAMVIIECDVCRKSCVKVSMERNMSVETVKRHRCKAYHKISQELFNTLP